MAEATENISTVITQTDPDLPEFLDFEILRKEGLEHIGALAGKIWTDHNAHDPGITILEVLVYALMDLGYKTNLPFTDIITPKEGSDTDDNFLTPLAILTVNPATITDYRKLLLEIEGVKNAWLEPVDQEVPMFIDPADNRLKCTPPQVPDPIEPVFTGDGVIGIPVSDAPCPIEDSRFMQLRINGIYQVYVEMDRDIVQNKKGEQDTVKEIQHLLAEHRNLCEDFRREICVLEPVAIGVCAEVEVDDAFVPEKVYGQIIREIRAFIEPQIPYYTLNELLDKGKTTDEIFAGRPYRSESYGFVDTEELEALEKRSEIYLSDLYSVVLNVAGVVRVKKIHINGGTELETPGFGKEAGDEDSSWVTGIRISQTQVPVFSLEETCVDLYSKQGYIPLNKFKVHQAFSFLQKFHLPAEQLDTQIPLGRYRKDVGSFESIQNDFPIVYGIGEDGLPDRAGLLRETQALQLKGYLLFYDQLLANYTAQLTNLRSLFSLTPETDRSASEKHTYFAQLAANIPELKALLKYYGEEAQLATGTTLAIPVARDIAWEKVCRLLESTPKPHLKVGGYCQDDPKTHLRIFTFSSVAVRAIYVNQLVTSFFDGNYTIDIASDKGGYFFILCPALPSDLLYIGTKRYQTNEDAYKEAVNSAFLFSLRESYRMVSDLTHPSGADYHYFNLDYNPICYIDIIQGLAECSHEYLERRQLFLDHLLARFGETFTDYTILQYQNSTNDTAEAQRKIEDQSVYVNQYAEISRNRARAFNYLKPSWNTDQVSGFEKRISLLSGINDYDRRNLCNFEVTPCYRLQLKDFKGNILFRSNRSYESRTELMQITNKVLKELRHVEAYPRLEKNLTGFDKEVVGRLFSVTPTEDQIVIAQHEYHHQLLNDKGEVVVDNLNKKFKSAQTAYKNEKAFIATLNSKEKKGRPNYRLLPLGEQNYLDTSVLNHNVKTIKRWKWIKFDDTTKKKVKSTFVFNSENEAWDQLVQLPEADNYLQLYKTAFRWKLRIKGNVILQGENYNPDKNSAVAIWRQAKMAGSTPHNFKVLEKEGANVLVLTNERGKCIATSGPIAEKSEAIKTLIADCVRVFSNRNTKPKYESAEGKFGFSIADKKGTPLLVSYSCFDSKKQALQHMGLVFTMGALKRNYLLSGDEGNPRYNLILKDGYDTFLALPSQAFETAIDRDKALKTTFEFFKTHVLPLQVKEEPRSYVWELLEGKRIIAAAAREFSSVAKAQHDFDTKITEAAKTGNLEILRNHIYKCNVATQPLNYRFLYGASNEDRELVPVFQSTVVFESYERAKEQYTSFAQKLPALLLKPSKTKEAIYDFALYEKGEKQPLALQYRSKDTVASLKDAKELITYVKEVYTQEGDPQEAFISDLRKREENRYEWRFYKKNAPVARSPYSCWEKGDAEKIKAIVCDKLPPISLEECPRKSKVVCPKKNPGKYHYQVCFKDNEGREFVLNSYVGYDSHEAAEAAYDLKWLEVIDLARDVTSYVGEVLGNRNGKISLVEQYKKPGSAACDEGALIAVVPEEVKNKRALEEQGLVALYTLLAELFPLYEIKNKKNEECYTKYAYRVVLEKEIKDAFCDFPDGKPYKNRILWESVDCYDTIAETLNAYRHFYTLAGIHNNCRVLCHQGKFYVGLVEVLVESACEFNSEAAAWDDAFPDKLVNDQYCGCPPGGVREFVYAGEDCENYIPICRDNYWTFKVVSPHYFVADHHCCYDSAEARDKELKKWKSALEGLDWEPYMTTDLWNEETLPANYGFLTHFISAAPRNDGLDDLCAFVEAVRECLPKCKKETVSKADAFENTLACLREKYRKNDAVWSTLQNPNFNLDDLQQLANYFPVYKSDEGYCYRLYWPANDTESTPFGLQPCDCGSEKEEETTGCDSDYIFVSSNCYPCCKEALNAFKGFCETFDKNGLTFECTEKTPYGPFSFQLVNKAKELGYHPQRYGCLQEVIDAMDHTKACIENTGMHLLEHILLRPKTKGACNDEVIIDANGERQGICCLLPICPDYCCDIEWQPDADKDDPCTESNPNTIFYLPGGDPYSFWATLVLPAWDKRFRNQAARTAFERLVYKEVPALVGLHILWLSPRDLCKFEDAYRVWLEWLQWKEHPDTDPDSTFCNPYGASPNCIITECIKQLRSEPPCPSLSGTEGNCKCEPQDKISDDHCCLPLEHSGTLFWGYCPPEAPPIDPPGDDVQFSALTALESAALKEDTKVETTTKPKSSAKARTKKKPTPKKEAPKKDNKALLAKVRMRKPQYLKNISALADKNIQSTKSYERAQFFIKNTPTVNGFLQLADFFNRYSLQKDTNLPAFLGIIENAIWHLLDKLILEVDQEVPKEELARLKASLFALKGKGLALANVQARWKAEEISALVNTKTLRQLKRILK